MNRKFKYLLFDVEVVHYNNTKYVYDFSAVVIDNTGKIYKRFYAVVKEIFTSPMMSNSKKFRRYNANINNNNIQLQPLNFIISKINQIMTDYNVKAVMSYGIHCDIIALQNTIKYVNRGGNFFPLTTIFYDLRIMVQNTITHTKKYNKWCIDNNFLTKNNNVLMTAEAVTSFLKGSRNKMRHTGIQDTYQEIAIFTATIQAHKKRLGIFYVNSNGKIIRVQ